MHSHHDDSKSASCENSSKSSVIDSEKSDLSSRESRERKDSSDDEPIIIDPKILYTYNTMIENFIDNMKSTLGHTQSEFAASRLGKSNFITFGYQNAIVEKKVGWKAHISIDDSDKVNLARAWDLVKNIIIDEMLVVKVVIPDADLYKDQDQCGKQITIYCHMTPGKDWEDIFHKIENTLSSEDVKPFRFSESDRQIPGSEYLSYRNDDNGKGQYIASKTDYNPGRHVDTFRNIEVQPYRVRFR